jgi:hypothetical protein
VVSNHAESKQAAIAAASRMVPKTMRRYPAFCPPVSAGNLQAGLPHPKREEEPLSHGRWENAVLEFSWTNPYRQRLVVPDQDAKPPPKFAEIEADRYHNFAEKSI